MIESVAVRPTDILSDDVGFEDEFDAVRSGVASCAFIPFSSLETTLSFYSDE